jgi:hypothetical protein
MLSVEDGSEVLSYQGVRPSAPSSSEDGSSKSGLDGSLQEVSLCEDMKAERSHVHKSNALFFGMNV